MLTYDCVNRETTMAIGDVQPCEYLATQRVGTTFNRALTTKSMANPNPTRSCGSLVPAANDVPSGVSTSD